MAQMETYQCGGTEDRPKEEVAMLLLTKMRGHFVNLRTGNSRGQAGQQGCDGTLR